MQVWVASRKVRNEVLLNQSTHGSFIGETPWKQICNKMVTKNTAPQNCTMTSSRRFPFKVQPQFHKLNCPLGSKRMIDKGPQDRKIQLEREQTRESHQQQRINPYATGCVDRKATQTKYQVHYWKVRMTMKAKMSIRARAHKNRNEPRRAGRSCTFTT